MILRAEAVKKRFAERTILAGASLTLEPGEVVLLVGANGSGKTTFARILATLLPPDDGEITLDDVPVDEKRSQSRRSIGYASHAPLLYQGLTPLENLEFFGRLTGIVAAAQRGAELLERFGLSAFARTPMTHFSRGMLQRVVLSRALLADPPFLILDEPYAGLDDEGVATINDVLADAKARGTAALLIAHDRERAAAIRTRALRLRAGRIEPAQEAA